MFHTPIIKNLSAKTHDITIIALVILMYVLTCAEADMYVPTFPEMIQFFGIAENEIQLILSINLAGLCFAGLVTGPLSDSYGRRIVLLGGLLMFVISSFGCVVTNDFNSMIFWRLLQGIAASVPMVIGAATIIDKYSVEKAGQIVGFMNSVISASIAGAPIAGAWISQAFNWRANFVVILGLSILTFIGTFLLIEETLPTEKRKRFHPSLVAKDYIKLLTNYDFMSYTLLANFSLTVIVAYIANISIIFVNHLGISLEKYSYYQATTMAIFIVFSLLSVKLIGRRGIDYTKNVGSLLALFGSIGMYVTSLIDANDVNMICLFMAFIATGGALMSGTFGMKALSIYPDINGTAMALRTAIRQFLATGLVILSEILFDGTIVPVAALIISYAFIATICYLIQEYKASLKTSEI